MPKADPFKQETPQAVQLGWRQKQALFQKAPPYPSERRPLIASPYCFITSKQPAPLARWPVAQPFPTEGAGRSWQVIYRAPQQIPRSGLFTHEQYSSSLLLRLLFPHKEQRAG